MKKKILQCIVCITLIICMSIIGFKTPKCIAAVPTTNVQISYLKSIGAPDEYINNLPEAHINYLYNKYSSMGDDVVFAGYTTRIIDIDETFSDDDMTTYGSIPSSQLRLTLDIIEFPNSQGKVASMYVDVLYEWLSEPFFHMTDGHMLNWNSNYFYMRDFESYSYYGGTAIDGDVMPATSSEGGAGWYLSTVRPSYISNSSLNFGGATFTLVPTVSYPINSGLGVNFFYTYAHQLVGAGISFGFSSGPEVGITLAGGKYDSQALTYRY